MSIFDKYLNHQKCVRCGVTFVTYDGQAYCEYCTIMLADHYSELIDVMREEEEKQRNENS